MKLKGKSAERLRPDQRARMERTLKRMEEVRRNDDMRLRDLITRKREWTIKERQKGFDIIDNLEKQKEKLTEQQNDIRQQIVKLDGCLLVLDDLIEESKKMESAEKAQKKTTKKTTRKKSTAKK